MSHEKQDLEGLRAESQQLSSRITRLSLILISALVVVTFTITNGLEKVDVRELKRDLDTANSTASLTYEIYQSRNATSKSGSDDPEQDRLRDEWFKTLDKQRELQQKYDSLLKEQFSINPSILGSGLKIDLRSWIYVISAAIHIQMRKKEKVHLVLFLVSAIVYLLTITDFSFSAFWFKDELFLLSNLFWLAPAVLLCYLTLSRSTSLRTLRLFLAAAVFPLIISATVFVTYVAVWQSYSGVLVYFLGLNLLSLTYWQLVRVDRKKNAVDREHLREEASPT